MENQNNETNKCCCGGHRPIVKIICGLILISAVIWLCADVANKIKTGKYIGKPLDSKNVLTVSDTGEIYAKPDLAITTFSVISNAKTVAKAMSDNTAKMNAVTDFLKKQGIKDTDLKTTNFSVYPKYEWAKATEFYPSGRQVLIGYEVQQSLEVKIRDMEKIGDIVQGATDAGSNQVGNLQFTIDKEDDLKVQAREEAIKKAKAKAKELASQLGVSLVRVSSFSENSSALRPYYDSYVAKEAYGMGGSSESVPTASVQTGENKISVSVTITYEIN
jgi:hypothetical protein